MALGGHRRRRDPGPAFDVARPDVLRADDRVARESALRGVHADDAAVARAPARRPPRPSTIFTPRRRAAFAKALVDEVGVRKSRIRLEADQRRIIEGCDRQQRRSGLRQSPRTPALGCLSARSGSQLVAFRRADQVAALTSPPDASSSSTVCGEVVEGAPRAPRQFDVLGHRSSGCAGCRTTATSSRSPRLALQHQHALRAERREVISHRRADHAAADHDHIVLFQGFLPQRCGSVGRGRRAAANISKPDAVLNRRLRRAVSAHCREHPVPRGRAARL